MRFWKRIFLVTALIAVMNSMIGTAQELRRPPWTWFVVIQVVSTGLDREADMQLTALKLSKRLTAFGVTEFNVSRYGAGSTDRLILQLPKVKDPERLKQLLVSEGKLELRGVYSVSSPEDITVYASRAEAAAKALKVGGEVFPYTLSAQEKKRRTKSSAEQFIVTDAESIVASNHVQDAQAVSTGDYGEKDSYAIHFSLLDAGADRLERWSSRNINNYIAVIYNDRAVSVAYIKSAIGKNGQIDGQFTKEEAYDLALILSQGKLPVPIVIVDTGSYEIRVT